MFVRVLLIEAAQVQIRRLELGVDTDGRAKVAFRSVVDALLRGCRSCCFLGEGSRD
jgi:hypothetical protein